MQYILIFLLILIFQCTSEIDESPRAIFNVDGNCVIVKKNYSVWVSTISTISAWEKHFFKEKNKLLLPPCAFEQSLNLLALYTKAAFFAQ